jgi:hypothetical protein
MNRKIYLTAAVCLLCLSQAQAQNFNINTGTPTTHTITVNPGVVADITLGNVNIDVRDLI